MMLGVNSLIWADRLGDFAPVWCDISAKLIIGMSIGIPASSICIQRQLYYIAATRGCRKSRQKGPNRIVDLLIGVGFPILVMALSFIVQPARYHIIEDVGCWPVLYHTHLAIPIVLIWPVIIETTSFICAGFTIYVLLRSRRQFSLILSESESGLTMSRYFRLMALAATEMLCGLPTALWIFISNIQIAQFQPWISWEDTHSQLSLVLYSPFEIVAKFESKSLIDMTRWSVPGCAFAFFVYFGLPSEATESYNRVFRKIVGSLLNVKSQGLTRLNSASSQGTFEGTAATQKCSKICRACNEDLESQV
ncbi:a-factor receptor [Ceratobasidium sp. 428]|nr:a-factor receptor [Ceratobasidium sp. 428]